MSRFPVSRRNPHDLIIEQVVAAMGPPPLLRDGLHELPHLRRLEPTVRQACFSYPAELLTREGYRAFGTGQACLNLGSAQSPPLTSTAEFRCDYFFAMQTPLYTPKQLAGRFSFISYPNSSDRPPRSS